MRRYVLEIRGREFVVDVEEQGPDRFEVVVGGESYEVTLSGDENLAEATITPAFMPGRAALRSGGASAAPASTPAADAAAPRAAGTRPAGGARPAALPAAPAPAARAPSRGAGGSATLSAPMPGVIAEVAVGPGDTVARGQQVAVLEAMKMMNSIKSPRAGTIAEVCVVAGQAVGHGDPIVRFKEG